MKKFFQSSRKQEPIPITSEDFKYIDEFGLDTLVTLIGAERDNQRHLYFLQRNWARYIEKIPSYLETHIKQLPDYVDLIDDAFDEYNLNRPEAFTEEDIIRDHVEPKSELYQQYFNAVDPQDPSVRIPPNTPYFSMRLNANIRKVAVKRMLRYLNKDRAIDRPDDDKKAEKIAKNRFPDIWERLYGSTIAPYAPTVEEYSGATLFNMLGDRFDDIGSLDIGKAPDLTRYRTKDKHKIQKTIRSRFDELVELSLYDAELEPLVVNMFSDALTSAVTSIQYEAAQR